MASKTTFRKIVMKCYTVVLVQILITTNFTKRYLVVPTELEEMKLEFMNNTSRTNEYIINIKKDPSHLKPYCK